MKLRKDLKLWAIGGRGWIEFRVAKVQPKAKSTTWSKTIPYEANIRTKVPDPATPYGYRVEYKKVWKEKKHTLKTTTWSGGRVVGSLPPQETFGGRVLPDTVETVPEAFVDRILKRLEERGA